MAEKYTSELLGIVIAQIAQTIGYSRTQSAPLELLEDILQRFIQELARDLHSQAEHANRVEPNLKDALLSLRNLNINVHELLDYIGNVEPIPFVREVPAYPVKRSSNMNFLKPGSAETLTRPVHIFEYLPPMLPTEPTAASSSSSSRWPDKASDQQHLQLCKLESNREAALTFGHKTAVKLLQDVKPDFVAAGIQKWSSQNDPAIASTSRDNLDHDGHAIREISSVVMTTGGFISPAIEGKLPEAYVPDIIDKFKGLDAPSISPPAPKTPETQKYSSNDVADVPVIKRMASLEAVPHSVEHAPIFNDSITPNSLQEVNAALKAGTASVPAPSNLKAKKNKKRNLVVGRPNDQTGDLNSIKAQEKAQRKALKIYQKLSKNQVDIGGNIMELKKSMKNRNRGMLSAFPDGSTERLQLEKLIRKQTKQRQKHLKSQKQQRQFPPLSKPGKAAINPVALLPESSADLEPTLVPFAHPLAASTAAADENVVGLVENKEIFQTNLAPTSASTTADATLTEEIKLASEPDRNKLNIFKKISKQKTPKPASPKPLNIGTNLFESPSNNVSPLITLPSGTTITPAPPAGATESVNMPLHSLGMSVGNNMATYDYMQPFGHLSTVPPTAANLMGIDTNKPRKRGRKPGGKNQARSLAPPTGLAPIPMQSPKKTKAAILNPYNPADPSIIDNSPALALPMEPLNLCHVDQLRSGNFSGFLADVSVGKAAVEPNTGAFSETSLKFQKAKEKKDRKKSKAKYINMDAKVVDNKKLGLMDTEKQISKNASFQAKLEIGDSNIQIPSDKFPGGTKNKVLDSSPPLMGNSNRLVASSGPSSFPPNSAALHPNSQPNMMPILPLLHFPPRPGLIPSGPGLFAPNLTGFNKTVACSPGSSMMMPNPFMPFPSRSTTTSDNKSALLGLLPLSDIHLERSYCNVAPLVPDSMKLPNQQQMVTNKLRSPHGFAPNEYTEKDISHSSPMPVAAKGVGLLGIADEAQTNQIARSIKAIKPTPAATGNVGDPIEVSDDSNDDESKAATKSQQISGYPQAHALKSGLIQPSNLLNSGPMQHMENSHLYAMNTTALHSPIIPDGIQFNKQAKPAPLKVTQPDSNPTPTPFNINFMGNDKFSLAGGADLIPLSRVDSGMAYSSLTVPATSLAAGATSGSMPIHAASDAPEQHFVGSLNYDDVTITPTNSLSISELKIRKLHKKLKKPKEGKIKKKKDKKDKVRNKEKGEERNTLNVDKPKSQDKKQKKDKKKEKQVAPPDELQIPKENVESGIHQSKNMALGAVGVVPPPGDSLPATVSQAPVTHHLLSPKLDLSPIQVPKLTLKLSGTPTQSLFEGDREISTISDVTPQTPNRTKREHSPELARFSPLVTRPPKPKQCESQTLNLSMATSASVSVPNASKTQTMPSMMSMPNPQAPILSATSPSWMSNPPPSTSTISASSVLLPQQLLHPSKQIPKMSSSSSSLSTTMPSVAAPSVSPKPSEGSQTSPANSELNRPSSYVDADGYRIWICPACGKVDDGSAMIGCDGCDAWYHWTCVGILVAPNDNEDWFCRVCITKKKVNGSDKKKKRTKKK